jgi:cell division initiation protein
MIDLTPLEVRKKKGDFKRQLRGYDPELVDDFLDMVADRMEQLVRENMSITERITMLETQVADYRVRENALTEALVSAQEMRDETRKQIAREAELARRESEMQSETIRTHALQAREREEEAIRHLRARQAQLLHSYRSFLERELAELSVMAETLEVNRVRPVFEEPEPVEEHPVTPLELPEEPIIPATPRRAAAPAAARAPAAPAPAPARPAAAQPTVPLPPAHSRFAPPQAASAHAPAPPAHPPASAREATPPALSVMDGKPAEPTQIVVNPPLQGIPLELTSEIDEPLPTPPQLDLADETDDDSENAWVSTLIERKS